LNLYDKEQEVVQSIEFVNPTYDSTHKVVISHNGMYILNISDDGVMNYDSDWFSEKRGY